MAENVGWAYLQIVPSTRGFRDKLASQINDDLKSVGRQGGSAYGRGFENSASEHVHRTAETTRTSLTSALGDVLTAVGAFSKTAGNMFARLAASVRAVGMSMGRIGAVAAIALPVVAVAAAEIIGQFVALASAAGTAAASIAAAFGALAIGAMLYAQTERGKEALAAFKAAATRILTGAAEPLFISFDKALNQITELLASIKPALVRVFTVLGATVETFVGRATSALAQLAPAFATFATGATSIARGLSSMFGLIASKVGPALAEFGASISRVGEKLGKNLGRAIADLLPRIIDLAERALPMLRAALRALWWGLSAVVALGNFFINTLGVLIRSVNFVRIKVLQLAKSLISLGNILPGVSVKMGKAAIEARIAAIEEANAAVNARFWGNEADTTAARLREMARSTRRATARTRDYIDTILRALQINISYQAQLDQTTRELREGAATLNLYTKEGRQNARAIVRLIQRGQQQIEMYKKQERGLFFVIAKTKDYTRQLLNAAHAAGVSTKALFDLIAAQHSVPPTVRSRIEDNFASTKAQVSALLRLIYDIPQKVTTTHILNTVVGVGGAIHPGFDATPFRAAGGPVAEDHPYIVGEKGPELFVPQQSGRIVPNNQLTDDRPDPAGALSPYAGLPPITINTTDRNESIADMVHEALFTLRVATRSGMVSQ